MIRLKAVRYKIYLILVTPDQMMLLFCKKQKTLSSHKHKHMYLNYDMKSSDIVTWSK